MRNMTKRERQKLERLGITKSNNQGYIMSIVEYNAYNDVIVEFDDEESTLVKCAWREFEKGCVQNPYELKKRFGKIKNNNQGIPMKIVKYNNATDIDVEFQDEYRYRVCKTTWQCFENGKIRNPYLPSVYGVGITGSKYPTWITEEEKHTKEYNIWRGMLCRCYDEKFKKKQPTYEDIICCENWLLFENFYEWLHKQPNFDKWYNGYSDWDLDKDILIKGNKIYSPDTCVLIPSIINNLFTKRQNYRGDLPIGVCFYEKTNNYAARCNNPLLNKYITIGLYSTPEEAFQAYKKYKENLIKQIAQIEYDKGNITEKCYDAMMNYKVEITD